MSELNPFQILAAIVAVIAGLLIGLPLSSARNEAASHLFGLCLQTDSVAVAATSCLIGTRLYIALAGVIGVTLMVYRALMG